MRGIQFGPELVYVVKADGRDRRQRFGGGAWRGGGALLTAGQVAALLGVPKSWVYEQSRRGSIPTVTLGRYRRYRVEAIEEWIERLEAGDAGGAQLMAKHARSVRASGKL